MANLQGLPQGFHSDTSTIDTTQQVPIGTRAHDVYGNEYIYLKGIGSTAAGSVVTFDEAGVTTLIAANAIGPVAVAMAATVANTWGWYAVRHLGLSCACDASITDNAKVYIDGTAGRVDDTVVTGDQITGMVFRSTDTSNFATVQLFYPQATDSLG